MGETERLDKHLQIAKAETDRSAQAEYYAGTILSDMASLREDADAAEMLTCAADWPFPTYTEMLYYL